MTVLLQCDGITVSGIRVPAFELFRGELLGLAVQAHYGPAWQHLMEALAGSKGFDQIHLHGAAELVGAQVPSGTATLRELAKSKGLVDLTPDEFIEKSGVPGDARLSSLGLTERLLLQLQLSDAAGVEIVVLSTAGLDPRGLRLISEEVSQTSVDKGVLHIFPLALIDHYQVLNANQRMIRCDSVM